jgi:hypothetical protein
MSYSRSIIPLVCVLATSIFLAGCTTHTATGNKTTDGQNYQSTLTIEPAGTTSLPLKNESPTILVNPIGEQFKGATFEVNGTTNFEIREPLHYSIDRGPIAYAMPGNKPTQYDNGVKNISFGEIRKISGGNNGQEWSFWLNTSGSEFKYGLLFILNVSTSNNTIYNSSSFLLNSRSMELNK